MARREAGMFGQRLDVVLDGDEMAAAALILLLASWIGYRLSLPILIERMSA